MGPLSELPSATLNVQLLSLVAVCVSAMLGLFLVFAWLQQRSVPALAWWGTAYLIGAAAIALWNVPAPHFPFASELPGAMIFVACGMIWNGVRLFHGRVLRPYSACAGALAWVVLCQWPAMAEGSMARIAAGALVVAAYTFFIMLELWRERRKSLFSRAAAFIVPGVHAAIFLLPLALKLWAPARFADSWLTVLAIETTIYGIGTAFIVLVMVKDHHVGYYRKVATTDALTGLLNRGAFLEAARKMHAAQGARGEAVTLIMFDLDHFKSVNDRFGHATGDSVLKEFARTAQSSVRATDLVGRLGGEEFVAMVPEPMEGACHVAERLRAAFEVAGLMVDDIAVNATVSSGLATSYKAEADIDAILLRADEALYLAKREGRNRFRCAPEEPGSEQARAKIADRLQGPGEGGLKRRFAARRQKAAPQTATG